MTRSDETEPQDVPETAGPPPLARRLDYAHPEDEAFDRMIRWFGGYRQIGFAAGLAMVAAVMGAHAHHDLYVLVGAVGGALVGLCLRIPPWRPE